jgi:L-rhamnose-H+ transport protein
MEQDQTLVGITFVLAGGAANGTSLLPLKYTRFWNWENTWVLYSLFSMVLIPWAIILYSAPGVWHVYHKASASTLALTMLFGGAWGIGSALYGLGVVRLGMALSFAVILGLTAALGSLIPLFVLHPEELPTARGFRVLFGVAIMIIGIALCAWAGKMRETVWMKRTRMDMPVRNPGGESAFLSGLIICILSGVFSSMLNFSFAFGSELIFRATDAGAEPIHASHLIWGLALPSGCVVNVGYCLYLLQKNRSWNRFKIEGTFPRYWGLAFIMGLLWAAGIFAYGIGAGQLGDLGAVIGWPMIISTSIITANLWGLLTGEWRGTGHRPLGIMIIGVSILIVSMFAFALANA